MPVEQVFEWLSEEPIAAASLGQVRSLGICTLHSYHACMYPKARHIATPACGCGFLHVPPDHICPGTVRVVSLLDPVPSSCAQVYRGKLRPEFGGVEVAVKVGVSVSVSHLQRSPSLMIQPHLVGQI